PDGAGLRSSARFGGSPLAAGGVRHLNEGRAVAQPTPRSGAVLPVRVARPGLTAFAISGSQDGGQRTLAAVGHRNAADVGIGGGVSHAVSDGGRHVCRREAFFIGIRRDNHARTVGSRGHHLVSLRLTLPARTLRGAPATYASMLSIS